jgi:hypothetical protein
MGACEEGRGIQPGDGPGGQRWERTKADTTWYEFACAYADMKWKQASAKYRKDIARALTAAAPAMLKPFQEALPIPAGPDQYG